jgi:hypothetical protein
MVHDAANLAFRFELQLKDGTRFPVPVGETRIAKPCTLVVVKDNAVYGTHSVDMQRGDIVCVDTDEMLKYGSLLSPDVKPSEKLVTVCFSKDDNNSAFVYEISISLGGGSSSSVFKGN